MALLVNFEKLNKLTHQDECEIRESKDHQRHHRCQWSVCQERIGVPSGGLYA